MRPVLFLHTDPDVAFILEQTTPLSFLDSKGEPTTHTPDFLVIWKNRRPTLIEAKPSTVISTKALKHPDRYKEVAPRKFEAILSAKAAADLGFTLRIITEANYEEVYLANAKMLDMYRRWDLEDPVSEAERSSICTQISARHGITMAEVECGAPSRRADVIYRMIAQGQRSWRWGFVFNTTATPGLAADEHKKSTPGQLSHQECEGDGKSCHRTST